MHYALRNRYPIENDRQVKTACEYFKRNLSRFSPDERVEAACNIEKRAEDLMVPIVDAWVVNYARPLKADAGYSPDFNRSMEMRKSACLTHKVMVTVGDKKVGGTGLVEGLIKQAAERKPLETLMAVREFDKLASLESHYDTLLPDPYMTVFGGFMNPEYDGVKVAGNKTNYDVVRAARSKQAMEKVAGAFGKAFATTFAKEPVRAAQGLGEAERALLGGLI